MGTLCEIREVGKRYPLGEQWVQALHSISLSIEAGEFLALSGPSGSGKTTLLNLIGCLDSPSEGEIHLEGVGLHALPKSSLAELRAEKIGFIFAPSFLLFCLFGGSV